MKIKYSNLSEYKEKMNYCHLCWSYFENAGLMAVYRKGDFEKVEEYIDEGDDVNVASRIRHSGESLQVYSTPLHRALLIG